MYRTPPLFSRSIDIVVGSSWFDDARIIPLDFLRLEPDGVITVFQPIFVKEYPHIG